jgi:hypothetical protein
MPHVAPDVPVFLVSVAWNSNTWNAATGGIQAIDFEKGGEPLPHWAGDDILPRWQAWVRQLVDITVTVDYVAPSTAEGTKASLVFVLRMADETTVKTVTITNMKLVRMSLSQSEAVAGSTRLRFVHESDDGQSDPVTVA